MSDKIWESLETFEKRIPKPCDRCGLASFEVIGREAFHPVQGMQIYSTRRDEFQGLRTESTAYHLLRCAGCGRGGMLEVFKIVKPSCLKRTKNEEGPPPSKNVPGRFYPSFLQPLSLPDNTPGDLKAEFKEAETCLTAGANRAGSALFRSALEKTLKANGYNNQSLFHMIDLACDDGLLTETLRKRAHAEIRTLGNDVVHDDWREVRSDEVELARHYCQRVIEAFYDDRATAEAQLRAKNRIA